jgi:hypothetical protein
MDSAGPQIRASFAKLTIGGVKRLPAHQAKAILELVGEPLRADIREAGMLEWLPAKSFFTIMNSLERVLEPSRAREFWRNVMQRSLEGRLLAPLRIGAIALYGRHPSSLIKRTPLAWSLVAKNCGVCEVSEPTKSSIVLAFDQLPQVARDSLGFVHFVAGGCDAAIAEVGVTGYVVTHAEQFARGTVKADVHWDSHAPPLTTLRR